MPIFWATSPSPDIKTAITPHAKPFTNPEIILLYCGARFCAKSIITGDAIIVIAPVKIKHKTANHGRVSYVKIKPIKSGQVAIIER